jgi:hypothetical protein
MDILGVEQFTVGWSLGCVSQHGSHCWHEARVTADTVGAAAIGLTESACVPTGFVLAKIVGARLPIRTAAAVSSTDDTAGTYVKGFVRSGVGSTCTHIESCAGSERFFEEVRLAGIAAVERDRKSRPSRGCP